MSSTNVPVSAGRGAALDPTSFPLDAPPPSLWQRLSLWASENKILVYTIAGVAVVVTGAGAIYYITDSRRAAVEEEKRRANKREKKKAKKEKGKEKEKDNTAAAPRVETETRMSESIPCRSTTNATTSRNTQAAIGRS
jgi:import receptor subunit TOM70